jgi:hypothetical protein
VSRARTLIGVTGRIVAGPWALAACRASAAAASTASATSSGWYATTWAGGAADPPVARIRGLLGDYHRALLVPDNDDAGRQCAEKLTAGSAVPHVLMGHLDEDARDLLARLGPVAFRTAIETTLSKTTNGVRHAS